MRPPITTRDVRTSIKIAIKLCMNRRRSQSASTEHSTLFSFKSQVDSSMRLKNTTVITFRYSCVFLVSGGKEFPHTGRIPFKPPLFRYRLTNFLYIFFDYYTYSRGFSWEVCIKLIYFHQNHKKIISFKQKSVFLN